MINLLAGRVTKNMVTVLQSFDHNEETIHSMAQSKGFRRVIYQILKLKFDCCIQKETSKCPVS